MSQGCTLDAVETALRAAQLRLVLTDNDGVLTDAGVWYSERGEELKRYSIRDGMGVALLREAGIDTAIVTQEPSGCVKGRASKLKIRALLGITDKRAALGDILSDTGLTPAQVAYIGDDVNDLEILREVARAGLTGAPADAVAEVLNLAHYRCKAPGGHGAFREFADWILSSRGV